MGIFLGLHNGLTGGRPNIGTNIPTVEILSSFFGYSNCLGLDEEAEIIANGCVYEYDGNGQFRTNVPSRAQVRVLCGKLLGKRVTFTGFLHKNVENCIF